ncbi:uncharacterized protein LOC129790875 [Lutzomyia longipalpis]|uniref:uncharacterized protein LOC129790875 n=1 Tax=Lutzomyia longipalpis TaxID=7200 RepID=UPI00248381BB|nr:uncharacterized protein LOC129790875 [Lutzomyia longipalpis]XP_055684669.1 uncharacterized protein LOC129790875 [Lutzomyia longipalpis]XP_055684670.1 uncharacterized protein LOC129790875 [Lutzomyia longipalpis]XP_055684672.1 uncharacterized protein LOC129790875 [Lutzomyia longipalpis]
MLRERGYFIFLLLFASECLMVHGSDYSHEYIEDVDKNAGDQFVSNEDVELLRPERVNHEPNEDYDREDTDTIFQNTPPQVHCIHRDQGRICDCGFRNEEAVLPIMMGSIAHVTVSNCKFVRVLNGTFSALTMLTRVTFVNIEDLVLDENSLSFPRQSLQLRVTLSFDNVIIEQIPSHAINGFINGLTFERCRIGWISPFAVTGIRLRLDAFAIRNTFISRIEHQAFKKFTTSTFQITNCTVRSQLPSRSFYDLDVLSSLHISHNNFTGRIHSRAFDFQVVSNVGIFQNYFGGLSGQSFVMSTINMPFITENNISLAETRAFIAIVVERDVQRRLNEPLFLDFSRNNFDTPDWPQPLIFAPEFRLIFTRNQFITPITCAQLNRIRDNEFFNLFSSETFFRLSDYIIDGGSAEVGGRDDVFSFAYITENFCIESSYFWWIILGIILFVLLLLVIFMILLCVWWRKQKEKRRLEIIQPEGKTYRETQIVMQIENHGLLKTDL